MIKPREAGVALLLFVACTIVLTWPLARNFTNAIPGDNGDAFVLLWNYWYVPHALSQPGLSLWHTPMQLAPYGADLIFHTNSILPAIATWPVQLLGGVAAACNVSVIFAITLTGFGFYLFFRDVGTSRAAAFVGGYAFAFCPFIFAHLPGHYTIVQTQFIPFALLFLRRSLSAPKFSWAALGLGMCVAGAAVTDLTVFVTTVVLLLVYLVTFLIEARHKPQLSRVAMWNVGGAAILSVALATPWMLAYSSATHAHDYTLGTPSLAKDYFTRPRDLLVPPVFHGLWGTVLNPTADRLPSRYGEAGGYLGWTCIALAAVGLIRAPRLNMPWAVAALLLINLSAGNRYTASSSVLRWFLLGHYLPDIPVLRELRIPARYTLGIHGCLAVMSASGFDLIRNALRGRISTVAFLAMPALILDFWFAPIPLRSVPPPSPYAKFLREQRGTLLIFPAGVGCGVGYNDGDFTSGQLVDQFTHHRPLISGYMSRIPNDVAKRFQSDEVFNALLRLQAGKSMESDALPDAQQVRQFCRTADIQWVVIGTGYSSEHPLRTYLVKSLDLHDSLAIDNAQLYRIAPE